MKTILAAVDTSSSADSVVTQAMTLARASKARVVLLTVVQPPIVTNEYAPLMENIAELAAISEKTAARHLATIQKRMKAGGVTTTTVQTMGAPVAFILEQAKKHAADYIVMGSHGHRALYDLLVGSTTHGVLFRAPCPVVIVPPGNKKMRRRKR